MSNTPTQVIIFNPNSNKEAIRIRTFNPTTRTYISDVVAKSGEDAVIAVARNINIEISELID